jgi:hypothetical protein
MLTGPPEAGHKAPPPPDNQIRPHGAEPIEKASPAAPYLVMSYTAHFLHLATDDADWTT